MISNAASRAVAVVVAVAVACSMVVSTAEAFTMTLPAHTEECFFEDLVENGRLQGSFEVVAGGFLDIDCAVYGPGGAVHYTVQRETEGRFLILAPTAGSYKICFSNKMSTLAQKVVSFNIHQGDSLISEDLATKDHVTPLENGISELASGVVNVQDEQRYMRARERMHRDTTESTNSRVLWFTFLETFLLISMSVWQIWTLRRFFSVSAEI